MNQMNRKTRNLAIRFLPVAVAAVALLLAAPAYAAAPGITASSGGSSIFNLSAAETYISQPDGTLIYSWGYGCLAGSVNPNTAATFAPAQFVSLGFCPAGQIPGPTLIVTEGIPFTVTLTNKLPAAAGNTSILFPGLTVSTASCATPGLLACEAIPGGTVTYTVTASGPGTHAYYSGTQSDLQIEMGLYGAVVVLPNTTQPCPAVGSDRQLLGKADYRLAPSAYDHPATCYDREYLFQFMELDSRIHRQAEEQVNQIRNCPLPAVGAPPCPTTLNVNTEPYRPNYYMINGRSMPDDMDADYAPNYPNQPYNGNPHMHPGDLVLLRTIGQGRWEHPFHQHGNHVRILGRDGNLILSQTDSAKLGGRMEFTTDTYPGQAYDGIFYWSGKGLGWDIYGHTPGNPNNPTCTPNTTGPAAGYDTSSTALANGNYYEWCADHNHPLEANPVGQVGGGGPATLFDPLIVTNGLWFNGTPYLGQEAVVRSRGNTPLPPGAALQNPPEESGIAFMWHSHNEREITTNDVFPGGMLMMMLVDPPGFFINETL
jgi:FtsP/CotA-like multicopper oxidase with cupredoxin domain